MGDSWTTVTRKANKGSNRKGKKKHQGIAYSQQAGKQEPEEDPVPKAIKQITEIYSALQGSLLYIELQEALASTIFDDTADVSFQEMVLYGLGCIASSHNARYQFAYALLVRQQHVKEEACMSMFDPELTEACATVAKHFGCLIISENESGKRAVNSKTLFFMPHCPMRLYSNLLWANWGSQLEHLAIIGNSFESYCERTVDPEIKKDETNCLFRLEGFTNELHLVLKKSSDHRLPHLQTAFNDMSLHSFPPSMLERASAAGLWATTPLEFVGNDLELVRKETLPVGSCCC
jgi:hypothetical protein